MDVERALLSKAIQVGAFEDVISRGIDVDHFADPDCQDIWDFAIDFMRQHKQSPSASVIKEEFPRFSTVVSKDPLSYHMERFVNHTKERMAVELVRDFHDAIEDPERVKEIELYALEMARALTEVVPAPRASRYSDGKVRMREYDKRLREGTQNGIFMGLPAIDEVTMGIQPHELVTIVAYMGVGKSTLMQHIAYSAYLQKKTILFISLEMEAAALLRKLDVMASNIRYWALKALDLNVGERKQWEKILDQAERDKHERDIIIRDDIANCTVDNVMAECLRYKPDLVVVDYLELMSTPRGSNAQTWEKISQTGIALKQNSRMMGIPCVTAAQLNKEGGKGDVGLHNVSYQSIGKHSDLMLGLAQDEDMEARKEMDVVALKNRDGKKNIRAHMRWDLETMDIHQKDSTSRFPERGKNPSLIGKERRKQTRLDIARNNGGRENPISGKFNVRKREAEHTDEKKPIKRKIKR